MVNTQDSILSWWNTVHSQSTKLFLTNHRLDQYIDYFDADAEFKKSKNVLEVGIGTGYATRAIAAAGKNVCCVDVSGVALSKVLDVAQVYEVTNMHMISANTIDVAFHVTVAQHVDDTMLKHHITHILRSLRDNGVCFMQFSECLELNQEKSELDAQKYGGWSRSVAEVTSMVTSLGGKCSSNHVIKSGKTWTWHGLKFHRQSHS